MRAPGGSIKVELGRARRDMGTMNTLTHVIAACSLALTALIIHILIRSNESIRPLDQAKYYKMVPVQGDVQAALNLVSSETLWLSAPCRANLSRQLPTTDVCVEERRTLRNKILDAMQCFTYSSQVCSYLRNITSGIIQNRTIGGTPTAVGRLLSGTVPNLDKLTYRELLYNAIKQAPVLFHNSYLAQQSDNNYVLRTSLFSLIAFSILANILVHVFDLYPMTRTRRIIMRIVTLAVFTFVASIAFAAGAIASYFTTGVGIWLPSLVVLFYYEAFMDPTITRPWYARTTRVRHSLSLLSGFFSLCPPHTIFFCPAVSLA